MSESKPKKVLIIAYLFPPIGGGGVQRALKMAKYLGEFGWEPHVLTVEPSYHVSLDESLLKQLPDHVHIHRTKQIAWNRGNSGTGASNRNESASTASNASSGGAKAKLKQALFPVLKKVKQYALIPDDQILWFPFAVLKGLEVMAQHDIDAVVSTSGPYTNHLVGLYLKRKTGKPWIADFRDPWTQNMHRPNVAWREWLEERMERMVLRESDMLLTVTNSFASNFKQKFQEELKRVEVIHNGFDREDYASLEGIEGDPELCTFIYTGIFYKERNPRLFLQAVKQLIDEGALPRESIRLQFAGVFDYPGYSENQDCVRQLGLEDIVEVMGHLPHRQALTAMKKADILMLVADTAPDSGRYIPGKLYEYMAIGHPMLALSLPGESTNIIERFGLGEVADPTSLAEIKAATLKLYEQWRLQREGVPGFDTIEGVADVEQTVIDTESGTASGTESGIASRTAFGAESGTASGTASASVQQVAVLSPGRDKTIGAANGAAKAKPSTLKYERKEQARLLALLLDDLT